MWLPFIHFSLLCTSYKYLFLSFGSIKFFTGSFIPPEWFLSIDYFFLALIWKPSALYYIWENKVWNSTYLTIFLFLPHTLKGKLIQNSCTHVFSFASSHLYMATESRNDVERNNHFPISSWENLYKNQDGSCRLGFYFSTMSLTKIWYMCKIKTNLKPDTLFNN